MPAPYPSAASRFRSGDYSDNERRSFGGTPRHHLRRFARNTSSHRFGDSRAEARATWRCVNVQAGQPAIWEL